MINEMVVRTYLVDVEGAVHEEPVVAVHGALQVQLEKRMAGIRV